MFNTITIRVSRLQGLDEKQREALKQSLGTCFWQPVDDYSEENCLQLQIKPTEILNGVALNNVLQFTHSLSNDYPTISIEAVLSETPANERQCLAVREQLLVEWERTSTQLTERIEAKKEDYLSLRVAMGEYATYRRAHHELTCVTEVNVEHLLRMRTILYEEYLCAANVYKQRKENKTEDIYGDVCLSKGRCDAYAIVLKEVTDGFRLPGTLSTNHDAHLYGQGLQ